MDVIDGPFMTMKHAIFRLVNQSALKIEWSSFSAQWRQSGTHG